MSEDPPVGASSARVDHGESLHPRGADQALPVGQPRLIAIGGLDPGGGAGLVRDFLTARTWGAAVRLIPTAWTEQSEVGVTGIEPRESSALGRAIRASLEQGDQAGGAGTTTEGRLSVKIGMLPNLPAVRRGE